ncbi:hypothetical protein [Halomicronema sp. CCY15110]|nr:hypothetical protein [Halomicronema sp. CCY15110]
MAIAATSPSIWEQRESSIALCQHRPPPTETPTEKISTCRNQGCDR